MECAGQSKTAANIQAAAPLTQEQAVPVIDLNQVAHLNHNRLVGFDDILTCKPY